MSFIKPNFVIEDIKHEQIMDKGHVIASPHEFEHQ
jgi:hypothetical protein